jgi:hypothetical protein
MTFNGLHGVIIQKIEIFISKDALGASPPPGKWPPIVNPKRLIHEILNPWFNYVVLKNTGCLY